MNSGRLITFFRWSAALAALAGIVLIYTRWVHVNQTTVALTFLLLVLVIASQWSLRYAVVTSVAAAVAYNFFFLPPIGHITIADTENWLALFVFLTTSVIGSRLSQRARDEAEAARSRQKEVELSFQLGRELLSFDNISNLTSALPMLIARVTGASAVRLYLLEGDKLFQHGVNLSSTIELPHLRQMALSLSDLQSTSPGETLIPIRAGVKPRGLLMMRGANLSNQSFHTVGDLTTISLDRTQAMEDVAKNEATKESERLRTLIIDSITHELRTPLTSIKGAASAMRANRDMPVEMRSELIDVVDEESDRLNLLVERATEMGRLDAQQVHMNFESVSVSDLLEGAYHLCAFHPEEHPVTISEIASMKVLADIELITKVICNLLENAAKYSPKGSPIFISAARDSGNISISVADRGYGIDEEEQALIFDRFYRARNPNASATGTGMGLAISKAIVEAHKGTIAVTSQPGAGSVFTLTLPEAA